MNHHRAFRSASLALLLLLPWTAVALAETVALADTAALSETVATVDGVPITRAEVEAALDPQLRELDRQRHRALEAGIEATIEARLLTLEAERRRITPDALVAAEVDTKIKPVSDAEIDRFYQENAARIRQPKDAVADQVRTYLDQQRAAELRRALIQGLRAKYAVVNAFEPLRVTLPNDDTPSRGPGDAPVTLAVFSDFQCPGCKGVAPVLDALHEAYPDQLKIAFRQFPLEQIHPRARRAGEASLCAHEQGKFWEMHDALFADQRALDDEDLTRRATELGLDTEAFVTCLASQSQNDIIDADLRIGAQAGVGGTPSLFVNGRPVVLTQGTSPEAQLAAVIDDELARAGKR